MGVLFVVDHGARGEHLGSGLLYLGHHRANTARLGLAFATTLDHPGQASAHRQDQWCVTAQLSAESFVESLKVFDHGTKQRQLPLHRYVLGQHLLQSQHQPCEGATTSTHLQRVHLSPMLTAEVAQHAQASQETNKRFALVQRPNQPDTDAQVASLIT
ncbi:hypothetical protein D3C80_1355640 [compost metagenome]